MNSRRLSHVLNMALLSAGVLIAAQACANSEPGTISGPARVIDGYLNRSAT